MLKRYRSPSAIKKRNKRLLIRGSITLGAITFLLIGASYFAHLSIFQIDSVRIQGLATLSEKQIQTIFDNQLAGTYGFLFPKKNIFLYPKDTIAEEINATYKQIETLDISLAGTHSVQVNIQERKPFALWCNDKKDSADCYFLDKKGYIYTKAPYFSGSTFLKYYGKISGDPLGIQFLSEEKIREITNLIANLEKQHLSIIGLEIENKNEYIAHLKGGGKLLFNDTVDFDVLAENLATVVAQNGIKKEDISKLEYIDIRFDKKVFFKIKE